MNLISQYSMLFFFNIRNYSHEVINIQRFEVELIIILPRMNNFNIKHKRAWNICFIKYYQHQTRSRKIKANKTQQISVKTLFFFRKNWTNTYLTTTTSKSFYIIFVDIFFLKSLIHEKVNRIWIFLTWNWQLIRDWREIKQKNMIHIYDVRIIDVTGVQ